VPFRVDLPPKEGDDWNDVLKYRNAQPFSCCPSAKCAGAEDAGILKRN
jgi:hypothetical protein